MKLEKTNERWDRPFENGQEGSSKLESVQFNVKDDEGNLIGSANISQYNGSASINFPEGGANVSVNGYSTIEKGVEMLKSVMGISE